MVLTASSLTTRGASDKGFRPLFDGKTLNGWVQKGGKASYEANDGMIIGNSVPNTTNSFLCTKQIYGDFTLRYEFLCDSQLNSGVQIRSECFDEAVNIEVKNKVKKIPAGCVHGYQVEIDPNKPARLWTAGVYDEARRG
jgi:hypothetical protein